MNTYEEIIKRLKQEKRITQKCLSLTNDVESWKKANDELRCLEFCIDKIKHYKDSEYIDKPLKLEKKQASIRDNFKPFPKGSFRLDFDE